MPSLKPFTNHFSPHRAPTITHSMVGLSKLWGFQLCRPEIVSKIFYLLYSIRSDYSAECLKANSLATFCHFPPLTIRHRFLDFLLIPVEKCLGRNCISLYLTPNSLNSGQIGCDMVIIKINIQLSQFKLSLIFSVENFIIGSE